MSQLNKIQNRFIELRIGLNLNQKEFADLLDLKQSQISQIETGARKISLSIKLRLQNKLKVIINWLNTGIGEKFKDGGITYDSFLKTGLTNVIDVDENNSPISTVKNINVPIYDVEFSAGTMLKLIESRDNYHPIGFLSIPEVSGCDAIIRAKGDSMKPRIHDGDWLGIKRQNNWKEWLPMGYIYAIDTDFAQLVKYIKKGKNKETYTIVSENKHYEDDEIPKGIINEIWAVKTILPFSRIETLI